MPTTTTTRAPAVISLYIPAGGNGKTTISANLGTALAKRGYRTVVIDLDPSGMLTTFLGGEPLPTEAGLSTALVQGRKWGGDAERLIFAHCDGVHFIPTDTGMSILADRLTSELRRELRVSQFISRHLSGLYDVVILDCPPAGSSLTDNALLAAASPGEGRPSGVLIPVVPDLKSWTKCGDAVEQIEVLADAFDVRIDLIGIVLNKVDGRTGKIARRFAAGFRGGPLPVVGQIGALHASVNAAEEQRRPVIAIRPDSRVAQQLDEIAAALVGDRA